MNNLMNCCKMVFPADAGGNFFFFNPPFRLFSLGSLGSFAAIWLENLILPRLHRPLLDCHSFSLD